MVTVHTPRDPVDQPLPRRAVGVTYIPVDLEDRTIELTLDVASAEAQAAVDAFPERYNAEWMAVMRAKLGLAASASPQSIGLTFKSQALQSPGSLPSGNAKTGSDAGTPACFGPLSIYRERE